MKFGAVVLVANDWRFLPAVVNQLLKVVDRCVLVRSINSFSGASLQLAPLPKFPVLSDRRITFLATDAAQEHEARNDGIKLLSSGPDACDYVFTLDADELFFERDLVFLKRAATTQHFRALISHFSTYWKTAEHLLVEPESSVAPVLIRSDVRFKRLRLLDGDVTFVRAPSVRCRHLSYVRTDQEVQEKIRLFGHAKEVVPNWYESVWKAWDKNRNLKNLHPTRPELYARSVYVPDRELSLLLRDTGCEFGNEQIGVSLETPVISKTEYRMLVSSDLPPCRARVIGFDNRQGLTKERVILKRELEKAGWTVEMADPNRVSIDRVPLQFFLENVSPELAARADRNVVIPNPEFWKSNVEDADVWAKTSHAAQVFDRMGARCSDVGWTSIDQLDPTIPRERSFLHVCGQSRRKGTDVLLEAWGRHPTWPLLTVVLSNAPDETPTNSTEGSAASNIRIIREYLSDSHVKELQNRSTFHIYPSLYEGFGHAIWEGLSCGALVFIPSGPPFDRFPPAFPRIRTAEMRTGEVVDDCHVSAEDLETAVEGALQLPLTAVQTLFAQNRTSWELNKNVFSASFTDALAHLTRPYAASPSTTRTDLIVCHSAHERCGIAEYGRQLDAALRINGISPISLSYAAPKQIESYVGAAPNSTLLVHYEPSLMSRRFMDVLSQCRSRGARIFLVCHWFSPDLLNGELAAIADKFIVHRDYGVDHPRVVVIPLACPVYEPKIERRELRGALFNVRDDRLILTTVGFLSGWKKIPELLRVLFQHPDWRDFDCVLRVQTPIPFSGDVDNQEGQIRNLLETLPAAQRERIQFSTEFLPDESLLDLVHASDLGFLFHAQHTNSSSAAVKQFVSARTPLVTTDSSHTSDVHGGIRRVNTFNPGIFVEELFAMARDRRLREQLRAELEGEYRRLNMNEVARAYADLIRSPS